MDRHDDGLDGSDALRRQRAFRLLELYRSMPAETQARPYIAALITRLELVVEDRPAVGFPLVVVAPVPRRRRVPGLGAAS